MNSLSSCQLHDALKILLISHFPFHFFTHHHHQFNVHFLPRLIKGMDGCFPTELGRQSTFSNILGPQFSHSDASISRKSCLVTILKAAVDDDLCQVDLNRWKYRNIKFISPVINFQTLI